MTICNNFLIQFFNFFTFIFYRCRQTFVYKIVHISTCISHVEVIEHLLDASWTMEDVYVEWIAIGCTTSP